MFGRAASFQNRQSICQRVLIQRRFGQSVQEVHGLKTSLQIEELCFRLQTRKEFSFKRNILHPVK